MALAQKLAQLQNEKHSLQKRTQGLEEHVEMLQSDVLQKKEMIRNLVRRIETGALSTNDNDGMQKTQMVRGRKMQSSRERVQQSERSCVDLISLSFRFLTRRCVFVSVCVLSSPL